MPRVVGPGLPGGRFKPLTGHEIERIHSTALDVLEQVGIADPLPEVARAALEQGAWFNEHERLCFSRAFVEDIIAGACKRFTIYARDPNFDVELGGNKVSYALSGQAVTIYEPETRTYRPSTLLDLYDLARLVDTLDNIHRVCQPIIARDMPDSYTNSVNIAYALLAATRKSFSCTIANPEEIELAVEMFDAVLGGAGEFRKRPFATIGCCPIVSPLRFGEDGSRVVMTSVRLGIPIDPAAAPQAGATAPAALAGALVQVTAEALAVLILANLFERGFPALFGAWPFVSDLRTGAFSGGSGEEAVLSAAAVQIGNYYGLPTCVGAGMTDSKLPDAQSGFEKALATALAGHAGANYVGESAGMHASLLGCSFESMVIDNDMLGAVQRSIRGIDVSDETLSFEAIKQAAFGEGHYLGSDQTLALMQSEYLYPQIVDRDPPNVWQAGGSQDMLERARARVREILSTHYPNYIDPAVDATFRARFPISLSPNDMRPDCGRW